MNDAVQTSRSWVSGSASRRSDDDICFGKRFSPASEFNREDWTDRDYRTGPYVRSVACAQQIVHQCHFDISCRGVMSTTAAAGGTGGRTPPADERRATTAFTIQIDAGHYRYSKHSCHRLNNAWTTVQKGIVRRSLLFMFMISFLDPLTRTPRNVVAVLLLQRQAVKSIAAGGEGGVGDNVMTSAAPDEYWPDRVCECSVFHQP